MNHNMEYPMDSAVEDEQEQPSVPCATLPQQNIEEPSPASPIVIMDPFEAAADEYYYRNKEEEEGLQNPLTFPSSYEIVLQNDSQKPKRHAPSKVTFIIEDQSLFDDLSHSSRPIETTPRSHRRNASQDTKLRKALQNGYASSQQEQPDDQDEYRDDSDTSFDDTLSTKDSALSNNDDGRHEWYNPLSLRHSFAPRQHKKSLSDGIDNSFRTLRTVTTTATASSTCSSSSSSSKPSASFSAEPCESLEDATPLPTFTSLSLSASYFSQVWGSSAADDSYLTEGFICVGELPRIY